MTSIGFYPDLTSVAFDNSFTDSKSDACAPVFGCTMQSLENTEDPFVVLWFNANPFIRDFDYMIIVILHASD
jgi:hypothetical protein